MSLSSKQLPSVFYQMYQKHMGTETHNESRAGSLIAIAKGWEEKARKVKSHFEAKYYDY